MPEIWPGKCSSCKKMALDFPSFSPGVVPLWASPKEAYCAPGFDFLNHTNSCIWNECYGWASLYSTSFLNLIFYHLLFMVCFNLISILGKSWTLPIILVVLFFSWQTVPRVSIEEAGKDTTHSEFVKDLIYHQSEGFQILQLCFLMLLSLWWGIKNSSQGYRRRRCLAEGTTWCPEAVH